MVETPPITSSLLAVVVLLADTAGGGPVESISGGDREDEVELDLLSWQLEEEGGPCDLE